MLQAPAGTTIGPGGLIVPMTNGVAPGSLSNPNTYTQGAEQDSQTIIDAMAAGSGSAQPVQVTAAAGSPPNAVAVSDPGIGNVGGWVVAGLVVLGTVLLLSDGDGDDDDYDDDDEDDEDDQ